MIKASIICTALLLNGGKPPVFMDPDLATANARVKSEIMAHPEIYPAGKCSVTTEDVTAAMAKEKADIDAAIALAKAADDDKKTKLIQAKALQSGLQSSTDPKDKFLLYLLNQELSKNGM